MATKTIKLINQGDVLLVPCSKPEGTLKAHNVETKKNPAKGKRVVLAEGEVTGHAHAFYDPDVVNFVINEATMRTYIEVLEPTSLKHEEHSMLGVGAGWYEVRTPVEYVPKELPKRVVD